MAFTPFVDDLAGIELLLFLVAVLLAYVGVQGFWAIRNDRPEDLRRALRGSAIPAGGLGVVILGLALWGEMTWPFLPSDGMSGYNIFFFDPMLLLGIVLGAYALSAYRDLPLQYVGLIALVAGAATAFYGWTGFTATPAFTKEPFDTFLLYGAFGLSGVLALPATLLVDRYLRAEVLGTAPWTISVGVPRAVLPRMNARGAQPVVPTPSPRGPTDTVATAHPPAWVQVALVAFPVAMVLASIAALWFFGTTLPGHLGHGPASAP